MNTKYYIFQDIEIVKSSNTICNIKIVILLKVFKYYIEL